MNKFYLYIKEDDELGEIINKILSAKEEEIILVIPERTRSLSHPANVEILKKEIENTDKKIFFSTEDEKIKALAKKYGLPLFLEDVEEKIFDIKPPKQKKDERKEEEIIFQKPKRNFNFWKLAYSFFIFFVIIGSAFIVYKFFKVKAEIILNITRNSIEINEVVTLKDKQISPDYENKILPGEYVNFEFNATEIATTTGQVSEDKPTLKVVFINYLDRAIPLVAGTRLSYGDNIFRTTEKIVIPAQDENGEPGKKSTVVILSSLKDNNLQIPSGADLDIVVWKTHKTKTAEGRLFTDVIKVKTESAYSYKSSKNIGSVSPDDITNIKLKLEDTLKKSMATKMALENKDYFYIFEPDLAKFEVQNISNDVGDKTDTISAIGKISYETIRTSKKDFDDFIKSLINKEILDKNKNLIIEKVNINKIEILDFDNKKKIMTIGIKGNAVLMPDLKLETLKSSLKGLKLEEAKNVLQIPGVKSVVIRIIPQWAERLPEDISKIKILIR
jgi:hypothetical protein